MAKKTQIQKFRDKARELEANESENRFSDTLRAIGRHKPSPEVKAKRKKR